MTLHYPFKHLGNIMNIDMSPAEELFLSLHTAVSLVSNPDGLLRAIASESPDVKHSMELFNCFNPDTYHFAILEACVDFVQDKARNRPRVLFTLRDEGPASQMQVVSVDISDPQHSISDHWEALLTQLAFHYPNTLKRIAESGTLINESRAMEVDRVAGNHKFCDYQKNFYRNMVGQFVELEEIEND